jgi:hypothetical protein
VDGIIEIAHQTLRIKLRKQKKKMKHPVLVSLIAQVFG